MSSEILAFHPKTGGEHSGNIPSMARPDEADWFLREWLAHFGKIQHSLTTELGWESKRANYLWHGTQPYKRKDVNSVAGWLGIEPYELLMPPQQAIGLRAFRAAALSVIGSAEVIGR